MLKFLRGMRSEDPTINRKDSQYDTEKIDRCRAIENIDTTYSRKICRGIVRADRSCAHVIQGSCGSRIPDSLAVPQDETDYCFATFMYPPRYICPPAPR